MLLFRWLKNPIFYIRKEAISTTLLKKTDSAEETTPAQPKKNSKPLFEQISVETSIEYLQSSAYKKTYEGLPVWTFYRRNFKGQFPPKTRNTCIRAGRIATASPCPICRDNYLVVDYRNIELIKQFISPHGLDILHPRKTGVCQKQFKNILVAILKARNYGFLTFDVPFRRYNYKLYFKKPPQIEWKEPKAEATTEGRAEANTSHT